MTKEYHSTFVKSSLSKIKDNQKLSQNKTSLTQGAIKNNINSNDVALTLFKQLKNDSVVTGKVLEKRRSELFIDLGVLGIGLVYGKEFENIKNQLKTTKIGDNIKAQVVKIQNQDGYIELSLKEISKIQFWDWLIEQQKEKNSINVTILGFNKGGLLTQVKEVPAFLPLSQLSSKYYPRVKNGDTNQILQKLQVLVGKTFNTTILDLNIEEKKIILSEKAKESEKVTEALKNWKEGEVVDGTISGIADFGLFLKFANQKSQKLTEPIKEIEGFIHKSEIDWKLVSNIHSMFTIGDKVQAKIVNITGAKIFLSLKALKENPWQEIAKKYQKDDYIIGQVVKFCPYGAFIVVKEGVQGLIHLSNFNYSENLMQKKLTINQKYNFKILNINELKRKLILDLDKKKISPTPT